MWSILALALMIQFGLGQAVQALASSVCAEHDRELEGESPFHNLMEVK